MIINIINIKKTIFLSIISISLLVFSGCSDTSDFDLKKECAEYNDKLEDLANESEQEDQSNGDINPSGVFYSKFLNTCVGTAWGRLEYYLGTTKPAQGYGSLGYHDDAYWGSYESVYFYDLLSGELVESIRWDESSNSETRTLQEWQDEVENYKKSLNLIE